MDLTDLQVELRSIEEHVASLQTEIEKMKPKTGKEQKEEFEKITRIAMQSPIKNTEISKINEVIQKEYIRCLSCLTVNSKGELYSKLLYLSRIAAGCREKISAEEIYQSGMEFDVDDMEKMCADFQELKYPFLVDAMILSNISGQADKKDLSVIVDMAFVLGCDRDDIEMVAKVARASLTEKFDILENVSIPEGKKWQKAFTQYIPEKWLATQRIHCGIIHVLNDGSRYLEGKLQGGSTVLFYIYMESRKSNGTLVQAEEVLVKGKVYLVEKTILSPRNGMLCFVIDKDKEQLKGSDCRIEQIYVISPFDTYDALCKWHKQNKQEAKK